MRPAFHLVAFRSFVVGFALMSMVACTSMQAINAPSPATIRETVHVGDDVDVTTRSGASLHLHITSVTDRELTGSQSDRTSRTVPMADIQALRVRKVSAAKTAGMSTLVVAAIVVIVLALVGFAGRALADDAGD